MISNMDTWTCACQLIRQHGGDAVVVALERMMQRTRIGDLEGEQTWYAIAAAACDLQREPFAGETVH